VSVSTSAGRRFTIGRHISIAYKTAGLLEASQTPSAPDMALGKDLLENILDALEIHGVFAHAIRMYDLYLVAGEPKYTLPDCIQEVRGMGMYINADDVNDSIDRPLGSGETQVKQMSRDEWQRMSSKSSESIPTHYWVNRDPQPPEVQLWPTPNEDDAVLRLPALRNLADADDASAELDLERFWHRYVQYALAGALAESKSLPREKVDALESRAASELVLCRSRANEGVGGCFVVGH
jgi:hypothetical protein